MCYLWVGALCVLQDDEDDWDEESGNIMAVYQNARVVLGADMSPNAQCGYLDVVEGGYYTERVPIATIGGEESPVHARWSRGPYSAWFGFDHPNPCSVVCRRDRHPLSERAWALQEQVLASRRVHFTRHEMVWECSSSLSCECMEFDRRVGTNDKYIPSAAIFPSSLDSYINWYRIVVEITDYQQGHHQPSGYPALSLKPGPTIP